MFRNKFLKLVIMVSIVIWTASPLGICYGNLTSDNEGLELLKCARKNWVGTTFYGIVSIQIHRPEDSPKYKLEVWSDKGGEPSFIKILVPADEAGTKYLLKEEQVWIFKPGAGQAIPLPQSALTSGFLGSDLYLEDVYRGTLSENYNVELLGTKTEQGEDEEIEISRLKLIPKPQAPVVFGKLEVEIRKSDCAVLNISYYDQRNTLIQTAEFSSFVKVGEKRIIPLKTKVTDLRKEGSYTIEEIKTYKFGVDIPAERFTKQCLVKGDEFCGSS